eukprot:1175621-Prorocentrum_minimum.AAC.2
MGDAKQQNAFIFILYLAREIQLADCRVLSSLPCTVGFPTGLTLYRVPDRVIPVIPRQAERPLNRAVS